MCLKWKFFKQNRPPPSTADSGSDGSRNVAPFNFRRTNTAFWTGVYERTVKTDSFNEVLMELHKLAGTVPDNDANEVISQSNSFTSPSFSADRLLKPDQATVEAVLQGSDNQEESEVLELAADYFDSSRMAHRLCCTLFQSIKQASDERKSMEETLASLPHSGELGDGNHHQVMERMHDLAESRNPFSDPASHMIPAVEASYGLLNGKVEEKRSEIRKRMRAVNYWRKGTVAMLLGLLVGASVVAVVVATHAAAGLAAAPVMVAARGRKKDEHTLECCRRRLRMGFLKRQSAQLEAVARGTFTVKRMLDTMFCLVARLNDDLEDSRRKVGFGWTHREVALSVQQVAKHLTKCHVRLAQRLSELEEHVVSCCLMIYKARSWVIQEFSPRLGN